MEKALLIINPSSGGEKAKNYEDKVLSKLRSRFEEVEVRYTKKAKDAFLFAKEAARERYKAVFVMGGDGTVNEGIGVIAQEEYRPAFGFFPLGTVNDLARALHIPLNPDKAIESFDRFCLRSMDIGRVNEGYFMNVVAIGAIPEAINTVESEEKTRWGKLAYFMAGFKKIISSRSYDFLLEIDGEKREIRSSILLIGLTNSIGGFEGILPEAQVNDGLLHMIYIKDETLLDTIKAVPDLLIGIDESVGNVEYIRFKKARIEQKEDEALRVNIDGDEGDALPVEIAVLPSHIQVYCPPEEEIADGKQSQGII